MLEKIALAIEGTVEEIIINERKNIGRDTQPRKLLFINERKQGRYAGCYECSEITCNILQKV